MRFAAPLQSWGVDSKFEKRGTERYPTKSGVVGMISAALGRKRDESIDDLSSLIFGVRIDQVGELIKDYHTAKSEKSSYVTNRYYLADAIFLVGLEGSDSLLLEIEKALKNPYFPIFLGRRSCPPEGEVLLGIREGKSVQEALESEKWQKRPYFQKKEAANIDLPIIIEGNNIGSRKVIKKDFPISFNQEHRKFDFTNKFYSKSKHVTNSLSYQYEKENSTNHDPLILLKEE
jgi:CRISPR system Cascade subunit CasD